ncbi:MAG TPA: hypothetical protein VG273_09090 [Bryobacteraceae bacterium]|jgi:hypothetical protein|nr:hypothetical protein [Bryobacteraceae bacterium]
MPGDLTAEFQKNLTDFLRIDTDTAFTFLDTATIEANSDPDHSRRAVQKARTALETIRRFLVRVKDPAVHAEIASRADQLESAIKSFN